MKFSHLHLADNASIVTQTVPGINSKFLLEEQDKYESNNRNYPRNIPIALKRGKGSIIEDVDGNLFLDFFAGCGVLNAGHNNDEILEAIQKQMAEIIHCLDFPTEVKIEFMKTLNAHLPPALKDKFKFNFCGPTGADAVEAALKLARLNTRRDNIISFQGAFHGMTTGALSVTSNKKNRAGLSVLNQSTQFVPYSYCYRCPFGKQPDACNLECAQHLGQLLDNPSSGLNKPAAVIVEPVQGEGGTIIPHEGFLEEVTRICREEEVLTIFDEVQAGFYRTGPMFSFQHTATVPDLVTVSKAFGGIGMPLAMLLIREELDVWKAGTHTGTFRGNQLSIAAGNAAIRFMVENDVQAHVKEMEEIMLDAFRMMQKRSKVMGDVRGIGLMFGIEYVKDKATKEPFPEYVNLLYRKLYENGVLIETGGHFSNVARFLPPLVTTKQMIYNFLEIFDRVNREVERTLTGEAVELTAVS